MDPKTQMSDLKYAKLRESWKTNKISEYRTFRSFTFTLSDFLIRPSCDPTTSKSHTWRTILTWTSNNVSKSEFFVSPISNISTDFVLGPDFSFQYFTSKGQTRLQMYSNQFFRLMIEYSIRFPIQPPFKVSISNFHTRRTKLTWLTILKLEFFEIQSDFRYNNYFSFQKSTFQNSNGEISTWLRKSIFSVPSVEYSIRFCIRPRLVFPNPNFVSEIWILESSCTSDGIFPENPISILMLVLCIFRIRSIFLISSPK